MGLNVQQLAVTSLSAHDREEVRGFHRPARTHVLHLLRSVLPHRGAGGVPPRPWRPSAWARPFPPEVAPTSCLDSCYGRPVPRRATSCERRRRTAEAEPLGERGCPGRGNPEPTRTARMARTIRARPPTKSAVRPHARAGRGRPRVVGLAQPRHPAAAVAPCALTVSASAAVAGVALAAVSGGLGVARAARQRHGPAPRAESPLCDAALNRSDCSPGSLFAAGLAHSTCPPQT